MSEGQHYAEFTLLNTTDYLIKVGFGPPDLETDSWPGKNQHWYGIDVDNGDLIHGLNPMRVEDKIPEWMANVRHRSRWKPGKSWSRKKGDKIGLLLDFEKRSLVVFKNGKKQGVAGQKMGKHGQLQTSLELGLALVWVATLGNQGDAVRIVQKAPPEAL